MRRVCDGDTPSASAIHCGDGNSSVYLTPSRTRTTSPYGTSAASQIARLKSKSPSRSVSPLSSQARCILGRLTGQHSVERQLRQQQPRTNLDDADACQPPGLNLGIGRVATDAQQLRRLVNRVRLALTLSQPRALNAHPSPAPPL